MRRLPPALVVLLGLATPVSGRAQQTVTPKGPLTLLEAINLGRTQGVDAAIARLNVRAADARVGQRRADLLPTINGNASYTRQTVNLDEFGIPVATGVTDPFSIYRLQLQARQTLFDASVIGRLRAARDTAIAAGLDAKAAGEISGATAGLAYLRALSALETVRARQADSTIAAALLDQARQLVAAGVSPAIDQTRSEVSFAAVRTQLEVARNGADRARLDLVRSLDLPSGTRLELADSLGPGALDLPLEPDSAAAYAREHRAELAAERARTEAAHRSLGAIRAEYLPSLGLSGQYQQTGQQTGTLAGSYAVQLQLTVPILDGFRRQHRVKEQNLRVEVQEIRERNQVNQVETEARQAVLDVASARQQVAIAGDRLRLAEQELAQAQERFQAGVAGTVETTNAQSSVISARDALIQARVNFGTARVAAYRALGVIDELH
ncbi:MAG TPA: TolC family protein [Gemmatimonadales bacterium]|jgi:outer membrane protein TolC|nr:TolC family protein [Gemmatimonadales bacterium]